MRRYRDGVKSLRFLGWGTEGGIHVLANLDIEKVAGRAASEIQVWDEGSASKECAKPSIPCCQRHETRTRI